MVSRPTTPDLRPAQLTRAQIERGIKRLERCRDSVQQFEPSSIDPRDPSASTRPLSTAIDTALVETFGAGTIEYKRYYTAQYFYYPISMAGPVSGYQIVEALSKERLKSIQLLDSAVTYLREKLEEIGETPALIADDDDDQSRLSSRKVFIVHGHDEGMKEGVARFLSAIGFDPIILHEQPNKGRTIIHKFREVAQTAGFAVVLLSPDDETTASQRRARQNVILELGFFLGALGPERVAALKKGDVETPSDFDGVIYTAYEGNWKSALATELQAVGYEIDWNKVMKP
ncbi:putative nucleotide-binding protein with TIR-like domain [Rhizobium sp. AG855]|nr:putative nucleotide-binding protein with TIR-like domain [Rhizobium sp. AG855]